MLKDRPSVFLQPATDDSFLEDRPSEGEGTVGALLLANLPPADAPPELLRLEGFAAK